MAPPGLTGRGLWLRGDVRYNDQINQAFREAAESPRYQGILGVTDEPLVSADFVSEPHSLQELMVIERIE